MKRFVTAARSAVAFLFVSLMFTAMAEVTPDDYAKKLTITLSDAVGEGELENFPVLVRLSESIQGFKYADFKEVKGADMIFTDEAGNLLSHEVDTWDASGTSLVWVKIPSAQAGVKIVCYFGGPSAAETVDPTAVWSNYTGVWHMGETKRGTYDEAEYDMVPNATGLAGTDGILDGQTKSGAAGAIGKSVDIATVPNTSKYQAGVYVPPSHDLHLFGNFTISCWLKTKRDDWTWQRTIGNLSDSKGFNIDNKNNGSDPGDGKGGGLKYSCNDGKINEYLAYDPVLSKDRWDMVSFIFDGKALKVYENGVLIIEQAGSKNSSSSASVLESEAMLGIGNFGPSFGAAKQTPWGGYIDEFRIVPDVQGAQYIAAEYAAVANPEFLSYGYVKDAKAVYYPIRLTIKSGSVAFSPEPDHVTEDVPYFLSDTDVTITATDETALEFREWRGNTTGATIDGATIVVKVLSEMSLEPVWKHAWKLGGSNPRTISSDGNVFPVDVTDSTGKVVVKSGGTISDSAGLVDFSLPIEDGSKYWISEIGDNAFYQNADVVTVVLPDTKPTDEKKLTKIGSQAFRECAILKSVVPFLPDSVKTVGTRAFYKSASLDGDLRIASPDFSIDTSKDWYCFQNSGRLTSIYLPSVSAVPPYGFSCASSSTTNITFGTGVVQFAGTRVFTGAAKGAEVYFPGKAPDFTTVASGHDRPFGTQTVIVYCDPTMDPEGWKSVMSLNVASADGKTAMRFDPLDESMKAAKDYPGKGTLGKFMGTYDKTTSYSYWLVAYKSPFRKPGLLLLVR